MAIIRKVTLGVDDVCIVKYVGGHWRQTDAVNEAVRQVATDMCIKPSQVRVIDVKRV